MYHNRIRRVSQDGIIDTIAGTGEVGYGGDGGPAIEATLNGPFLISSDLQGNLYFSDAGNHVIRKISPAGIISTVAGNGEPGFSGDGGPAVEAQLDEPTCAEIMADGTIYICDFRNNRIRVVTPDGIINTFAGSGFNGWGVEGSFAKDTPVNYPFSLAVAPSVDDGPVESHDII